MLTEGLDRTLLVRGGGREVWKFLTQKKQSLQIMLYVTLYKFETFETGDHYILVNGNGRNIK